MISTISIIFFQFLHIIVMHIEDSSQTRCLELRDTLLANISLLAWS